MSASGPVINRVRIRENPGQLRDLGFDLVHVLLSYSRRPDLAMDLEAIVSQLRRALTRKSVERVSVQSEAAPRVWRIADRFDEVELQTLIANFRAGLTLTQLVAQYGISRSSIQRLLRANGVSRK